MRVRRISRIGTALVSAMLSGAFLLGAGVSGWAQDSHSPQESRSAQGSRSAQDSHQAQPPTRPAPDRMSAAIGKALFKRPWVPAPSSTKANDGLGPLFNARSCLSCHQGLDRMPPLRDASGRVASEALVLRFSDSVGQPDPVYGRQLQTSAVQEHRPEGALSAAGGTLHPTALAYGPLAAGTRSGARDAPGLRGLGLIAEVPDAALLALEDPMDRDGDGVRGRVNRLADGRIGRFGWKAAAASLADQIETAFSLDLGLSTAGHPGPAGDCTPAQSLCWEGPHGGTHRSAEITGDIVAMLDAYLASVPAPTPAPPPVRPDAAGARLFIATGCAACHRPALPTRSGGIARAFTDLLLHDMGDGLDGGATEPGVAPREWRTAPLWGLSRTLAAGAGLLHDGRAADVADAIALHGGEAEGARRSFYALSDAERRRLITYVEGL